jgi:hypothetical protein
MTKENANENNFEQNKSTRPLDDLVNKHVQHLNKIRERVVERTASYPQSISEYKKLELNDRMTAAVSIYRGEMSKKDFAFSISDLSSEEYGEIDASVSYSDGEWTNALNDTRIDKLPHLSIHIVTTLNDYYTSDHLADLEKVSHYEEKGYKNYNFTHNTFRVVENGFKKDYISDPEHPLFQDVVKIIDEGVCALYQEKITPRIEKLGSIAIHSTEE